MSRSLSIAVITFNCGRTLVDVDEFAAHLSQPFRYSQQSWPDLLVFSLQEVAPVAHSFLGGSFLSPYVHQIVKAVKVASSTTAEYDLFITRNVGMTAVVVLGKPHVLATIQQVKTGGVGVGLWEMGNKGAVGVRMSVADGPSIAFVAAHLAPMEDQWQRRNKDWADIVKGLAFTSVSLASKARLASEDRQSAEAQPLLDSASPSDSSVEALFAPYSPLFFAGDLNYRTSDIKPTPNDSNAFPQPGNDITRVLDNYFQHDQLNRERSAGNTLHGLSEAPIHFPPTYKYSPARQSQPWGKDGSEPSAWKWAKHRFPSWCDRVLYSSFLSSAIEVEQYTALPLEATSDHRPVIFVFSLDLDKASKAATSDQTSAPFSLNKDWRQRRAAARRREVVVGIAAYLGTTWEGNGLLLATILGAVGGWLIIRSLIET